MLARRGRSTSTLLDGPDFLTLVIHDLRTPLNVIGLSLRMIALCFPKGDPQTEEDLRFVNETSIRLNICSQF